MIETSTRILDWIGLLLLIFVFIVLVYGIIAVHDIPYEIARKRKHPHLEAIHAAGIVSLFLLHTIWPFLWIWAYLFTDPVPPNEEDEEKNIDSKSKKLKKHNESKRKRHVMFNLFNNIRLHLKNHKHEDF